MNKNTAIKVQNLTKAYKLYSQPMDRLKESLHPFKKKYHKDFNALADVSFDIKRGEVVGIIGRNGSGKSTLLKIITGVLTPTSGRVNIHGKISAILELGAGFNPEMTGMENIYLNTSINGMSKKDTDSKIKDIVDFAELGEFIHQPTKRYSSGMKARLGFAVAINIKPDILIVDEALSVGDAAFQRKCFAKMEEIRQSGATILFVSHSEGSIVSLCSRAIWISNGKQIIDGTPKLVTGLYMKHINENKIDKSKIEKEYKALENNKEKKQPQEEKPKEEKPKEQKNPTSKNSPIEEFFNPALKPKSTIYYEEKGAKISDVKITTLDGKEVNILKYNEKYLVNIDYLIKKSFPHISFGIHIKDTKGNQLTGIQFNKENKIMIDKGWITVKYLFHTIYASGDYFITCGIKNQENKEFIHRVSDIKMFQIKNASQNILGYFNSFDVSEAIMNNNIVFKKKDI